jgi:hypothetical protein
MLNLTFPLSFSHVTQEQDAENIILTQVRARKNGPTYAVDVRISVSAKHYQLAQAVDDLRIRMRGEIEEHYADVNDIAIEMSLVSEEELAELKRKRAENPPPPVPWEREHEQDDGHDHSALGHRHKH